MNRTRKILLMLNLILMALNMFCYGLTHHWWSLASGVFSFVILAVHIIRATPVGYYYDLEKEKWKFTSL